MPSTQNYLAAQLGTQSWNGYTQSQGTIDTLNKDIENLVQGAKSEFAQSPWDNSIQQRLKALLDLQSILQSQQLPPDQIKLIKDQVAQLSLVSKPVPEPNLPQPTPTPTPPVIAPQVSQPQPPPATPLSSLFPSNALAALLASVVTPQPSSTPPQQAIPAAVLPPPQSNIATTYGQPQPAPTPAPVPDSGTLFASLRAMGMLPPVSSTAATPTVIPPPIPPSTSLPFSFPPPYPRPSFLGTPPVNPASLARPPLAEITNDVDMTSASIKM